MRSPYGRVPEFSEQQKELLRYIWEIEQNVHQKKLKEALAEVDRLRVYVKKMPQ